MLTSADSRVEMAEASPWQVRTECQTIHFMKSQPIQRTTHSTGTMKLKLVKLLSIPLLLLSHTTLTGTITNILLLLLHDFTQHAVKFSHRWNGLLRGILRRRYIISAILGTQLYYLNQALLQATLFTGVLLADGDFAVLLQALLNGQRFDGAEIAAMFLATLPECIVNVIGYWLAAIGYANLSVRPRIVGCRSDLVCIDDVFIGAGISTVGLRFGICVVNMLGRRVYANLASGMSSAITPPEWVRFPGEIFDLIGYLSCQTLVASGVAAEKLLGQPGMMRKALVRSFFLEVVIRFLRVGISASWGWWGFNLAIFAAAIYVLASIVQQTHEIVRELKKIEGIREKYRVRS